MRDDACSSPADDHFLIYGALPANNHGRGLSFMPIASASVRHAIVTGRGNDTFRYDSERHEYRLNGEIVPSVTQMLSKTGYLTEAWFTEDSAFRGQEVHRLCTDLDLGAIEDVAACDAPKYKGWVLAYVAFLARVRPEWDQIEVARVHPTQRWGGRPDRVGKVWGVEAIVEIKSGGPERWHGLQLCLHDILLADLPLGVRKRYGLYLKKTGKFQLIEYANRHDYDQAKGVLQQCLSS